MVGLRKKNPRAWRVKSGLRVLGLAASIMAVVTPRLSADITLVSRLSDARAYAHTKGHDDAPPPQEQTDFLPASLGNSASAPAAKGGTGASASCTSNSSIAVDNSMGTLRVTGNGQVHVLALVPTADAQASAKLIVVSFTLTDRSYFYSLTGQLPGGCCSGILVATAKLAAGTSTIFEVVTPPPVILSKTGTLPPGTYTLSVDYTASTQGGPPPVFVDAFANFNFALDPTSTPTATPTPTPAVNIFGNISDCLNAVPSPAPNVTLTLTGSASASIQSDGSGNYQFLALPSGGTYTVTPNKAAKLPGSTGINTVDVIATQRHFLNIGTPLTGCKLAAADVNGVGGVNTVDVIAIQRFFLGSSTGIANVGKYQFSPGNRSYLNVVSDQTGQNYDTLIVGDVAVPFVAP